MSPAVIEIRNLIAGRPGGVNAFMQRWGKLLVDYATAIIPDRAAPFDQLVEDLFVDAISQARGIADAQSEPQVRAFVIEAALRTVRARYRAQLDAPAAPTKATTTFTVDEIMARTGMKAEAITAGISEGRIGAIRRDNQMRVRGDDVPGLAMQGNMRAWRVSAAQRELLCLRYRLNMSPEEIGRFSGASAASVETLIEEAAARMATGKSGHATLPAADSEMRKYIDGQLSHDETSRFENRALRDKATQHRLDQLRSQHDDMRALFDSPPHDLSRAAINVRDRNPHQPLAIPPVAALWLQAVGVAALVLLLHRVGAYLPPPEVRLDAIEGLVSIDDGRPASALPQGRLVVGQSVSTGEGGQAALAVDASNRVRLAGNSRVTLREPRPAVRQVLQLDSGEIWARFVSTGHAFCVMAAGLEVRSDTAAEFGLATGGHAQATLPDNLNAEQATAFSGAFKSADGGIAAQRAFEALAGFTVEPAIRAGDVLAKLDDIVLEQPGALRAALVALPPGQEARLAGTRDGAAVNITLKRAEIVPEMILRVYRGSVFLAHGSGEAEQVNRGQWAIVLPGQPPLVGQRDLEDFRLLRMDSADRFKDRLHWLNTESFPLRAENGLLQVERSLRELAANLERLRANEVERSGVAEIRRFEEVMLATIASAKERVAKGEALPHGPRIGALSDEQIVQAEGEILAVIAHWLRQSTSGAWPTLGSAGKTLHGRIQRDTDEANERNASIGRADALRLDIAELDKNIAEKAAVIEHRQADALHDPDGSKRKVLDADAEKLGPVVKAGSDARARAELVMLKLNELDAQLDELRRRLPAARGDAAAAELLLKDLDAKLAANIYTPAALAAAEATVAQAIEHAAAAAKKLADREKDFTTADAVLATARATFSKAEKDAAGPIAARDRAQDALTDAVTARAAAQKSHDDRKADADRLQSEHDALPPGDAGRAEAKRKLDAAKAALTDAATALTTVSKTTDQAKAAFDAADAKAKAAEKIADDAKAARTKAEEGREAAATARDQADRADAAAKKAERDARGKVDELKAARTEREKLDADRLSVVEQLSTARSVLAKLEQDIAAVDADARPRREKLAEERKLMDEGVEAQKQIETLKTRRDQHQAVSDEIALHKKDQADFVAQRGKLADSDLVKNYDTLHAEYRQFNFRAEALTWLRDRAMQEDENFALAQRAAQDRYREIAVESTRKAVALLDKACLPYTGFRLADSDADAKLVRERLMNAMWRLYYEPGIEAAPDGQAVVCYYVIRQAGGGEDQLRAIDDRWKLALAQVFDKQRYEQAARLEPGSLAGESGNGD